MTNREDELAGNTYTQGMVEAATARAELAESALKVANENIATMNARIALDAKSYERDQYLIGQLRKQLRSLAALSGKEGA